MKDLREKMNLSQSEFADYFHVSVRTLQKWENGTRTPPEYVKWMMERIMELERENNMLKEKTGIYRYLFFDIDGVLNTEASWKKPYQLSEEKIGLLAELCRNTGAKPVLTSTWRLGYSEDYEECSEQIKRLIDMFAVHGISIFAATPVLKGRSRDKEIERFLYFHEDNGYVILDDDESLYENSKNLYRVDCKTGLTKKDINRIEKMFR